jgi:multidrug resistance efflux pump
MTWTNRFRLFVGLLGVLVLVAVLTLVFNQRQTKAQSLSAEIETDTASIGAGYGGTVIKQYVDNAQQVEVGEKLFTLQSPALQADVANDIEVKGNGAYDVNAKKGRITYKATVAGRVDDLTAKLGTTLTPGSPFAKITVTGSQYVEAHYLLTPRDYERVEAGAPVSILLPNNQKIQGTVSDIRVATEHAKAAAEIRVDGDQLSDPSRATLTRTGTPVVATVQLRDDGPLAGVTDSLFSFARKIGVQ